MPPYWFVFDLDETLTHMNPYFNIICSFFTDEVATEARQPSLAGVRTPAIDGPLQNAYQQFVRDIAAEELGPTPIGILRPGILDLFREIARLRDAGLAGGAFIYSNNGTMRVLNFVADIIHQALGRQDLICDYSHLRDLRRTPEGRTKTFARIQNIIRTGPCGPVAPPAPAPEDVFFFDDTEHPDIRTAIGPNYIRVLPYTYLINVDRVAALYIKALTDAGILTNDALRRDFFEFTNKACFPKIKPGNAGNALQPILRERMKTALSHTPYGSANPPVYDGSLDDILARLRAMGANNLGNNPLNAIQVNALAGGRRRKRSSRKTKKASRKNRRNNRTKWRRQRA